MSVPGRQERRESAHDAYGDTPDSPAGFTEVVHRAPQLLFLFSAGGPQSLSRP